MEKRIQWTSKLRWALLALWIGLAAVSALALPDLQEIVKKTEQKFLPPDSESLQAAKLLDQIHPSSRSASNAVIVLSRDGGLQAEDMAWMNDLLDRLERDKTQLGITDVLSSRTQPELKERFLSKDGTTMLAIVNLPQADFEDATRATVDKLKGLLDQAPKGTRAELTGSAPISQEFQQSSQDGLKKTELLTVVLVLVILLIVFRSPIAPLNPLFTIGISLVISRGLIAVAADWGLPVSNFTESFLIAVLFGAGTDYCILLIQRFREELAKDGDRRLAMSRTMKGVGQTIVFSASTVFAAFFLIGFARFGLYTVGGGRRHRRRRDADCGHDAGSGASASVGTRRLLADESRRRQRTWRIPAVGSRRRAWRQAGRACDSCRGDPAGSNYLVVQRTAVL